MKRLIDEEYVPGSPESLLAELVRATPPLEPGPLERQRVFALVTGSARRPRRVAVRVGAAGLLLGGAAAAALGPSWIGRRVTPAEAPLSAPLLPAPAVPQMAPTSEAQAQPAPVIPRISNDAPSTRLKSVVRPTSAAFKDGEDPAPVLEAIRALRSEGDPARASLLLAEYLKAHPHSVLSEDALALSIESAIARHDPHAASEFGRRYLAQFPSGRYRAFALRATAP